MRDKNVGNKLFFTYLMSKLSVQYPFYFRHNAQLFLVELNLLFLRFLLGWYWNRKHYLFIFKLIPAGVIYLFFFKFIPQLICNYFYRAVSCLILFIFQKLIKKLYNWRLASGLAARNRVVNGPTSSGPNPARTRKLI